MFHLKKSKPASWIILLVLTVSMLLSFGVSANPEEAPAADEAVVTEVTPEEVAPIAETEAQKPAANPAPIKESPVPSDKAEPVEAEEKAEVAEEPKAEEAEELSENELAVKFLTENGSYAEASEEIKEEYKQHASVYVHKDNYGGNIGADKNFKTNVEKAVEAKRADIKFFATWFALLAPVIAIVLALITKEVYSSLFIGIVVGGLFAANFKPVAALDVLLGEGIIAAVSDTAGIFVFLVVLGIIVALVNKAGGSRAFGEWAKRRIKTRVGATFATFALGVLIFIDDYFNCLTVGSVMRPVTDTHKISRAKLSFIIDATAAPICMIAPISSWAAAVSSYAPEGKGISLFVSAIPYNFYSLLMIVFVIALAVMKFDYGPMKLHEMNAITKGDLYTCGDKNEVAEETPSSKGKVLDLVLPIVVLIIVCVIALIYVGGFFAGADFVTAFSETDATVGLPWGGLLALVFTIIYLVARRVVSFKEAMDCIPKGFNAMVPAILILTFATALKNMTVILGANVFVGNLMNGVSESLAAFLPAVVFVVACILAFSTGTSWGTFGILIPIVTAMFQPTNPLYIIGMSACLAGAVCGDHCSPISDTTIMSSAGAQCNHLNHVSTQLPYAITVAAVSFVSYIIAGFVKNVFIALPVAIAIMIGTLVVIKTITADKKSVQ